MKQELVAFAPVYRNRIRVCLVGGALLALACSGPARPASSKAVEQPRAECEGAPPSFEREVRPVLAQYCFGCHARGGSATEEHDFEHFETLVAQRRRVAAAVRAHAMPPSSAPQPSERERAALTSWASCSRPDPSQT